MPPPSCPNPKWRSDDWRLAHWVSTHHFQAGNDEVATCHFGFDYEMRTFRHRSDIQFRGDSATGYQKAPKYIRSCLCWRIEHGWTCIYSTYLVLFSFCFLVMFPVDLLCRARPGKWRESNSSQCWKRVSHWRMSCRHIARRMADDDGSR
jgi:hypothetical protein